MPEQFLTVMWQGVAEDKTKTCVSGDPSLHYRYGFTFSQLSNVRTDYSNDMYVLVEKDVSKQSARILKRNLSQCFNLQTRMDQTVDMLTSNITNKHYTKNDTWMVDMIENRQWLRSRDNDMIKVMTMSPGTDQSSATENLLESVEDFTWRVLDSVTKETLCLFAVESIPYSDFRLTHDRNTNSCHGWLTVIVKIDADIASEFGILNSLDSKDTVFCTKQNTLSVTKRPSITTISYEKDIFHRKGADGFSAMESATVATAVYEGIYGMNIIPFFEFTAVIPQHALAKPFKWLSSRYRALGRAIFPADFSPNLPVEVASPEFLSYYGATLYNSLTTTSLTLNHDYTIHDIHYSDTYLQNYVLRVKGGSCLETHEFCHLECPLERDSGHFIVGKVVDDELHLTAFAVPTWCAVYLPGGVIHSNDYLRANWRTMLCLGVDLDEVRLLRQQKHGQALYGFSFLFNN